VEGNCVIPLYFHIQDGAPSAMSGARLHFAAVQPHAVALPVKQGPAARALADPPVHTITFGSVSTATVNTGEYAKYNLAFSPTQHPDFTIELTPTGGDANLYVNVGGPADNYPTWQNADHKSTAFGVDTVRIVASDPKIASNCSPTQCTLYISVTNSDLFQPGVTFDLTVVGTGNDITQLTEGVAVIAALNVPPGTSENVYDYFNFNMPNAEPRIVSLASLTGDADMYIGYGPTMNRPTMGNNNGKSVSLGNDELTVQCPPPNNADGCALYIGVHGFANGNTSFSIRVSVPHTSIELLSGIAQDGQLSRGDTQQYTFRLPDAEVRGASIWVLPTSGDPDLYVNVNGQDPTPGNSQKHSFHLQGIEYIQLTPDWLATQKTSCPPNGACIAHIAVVAYDDCEFLITASGSEGANNYTALSSGLPLAGSVGGGQYVYYTYTPTTYDVITTIALTPRSGDPDVYIKAGSPDTPLHPTDNDFTWSAAGFGNDTVVIEADDARLFAGSVLYIAVRAFGVSEATFYIQALSDTPQAVTRITPGAPLRGETTTPGKLVYYAFGTSGDENFASVQFEAVGLSHDIRMYVAVTPAGAQFKLPAVDCVTTNGDGMCTQYAVVPNTVDYTGNQMEDGNFLIRLSDPAVLAKHQTFIIAVLGVDQEGFNSEFEVSVSVTESTAADDDKTPNTPPINELEWGLAQDGVVFTSDSKHGEHYNFYSVLLDSKSDVRVTALATIGSTWLYGSSSKQYPKLGNTDFRGSEAGGVPGLAEMFIPYAALPAACTGSVDAGSTCTLYFSATHSSFQSAPNTTYSIKAEVTGSSPTSPSTLAIGAESLSFVGRQQYNYYIAEVDVEDGTPIYISLVSYSGDADLFVNIGGPDVTFYPSGSNTAMYLSLDIDDNDVVSIHPGDAHYCTKCKLYISVSGFSAAGSFYGITWSTADELNTLGVNRPFLAGTVPASGLTYYRVDMSQYAWRHVDLTINLNVLSGQPSLVVIQDDGAAPPTLPSEQSYTWRLPYYSPHKALLIGADDPKACNDRNCAYIVGVYGSALSEASFSIGAHVDTAPPGVTVLNNGESVDATVKADQCEYFYFVGALDNTLPVTTDLEWEAQTGGAISAYVTNQYVPGVSKSDELPNSFSTDGCVLKYTSGETRTRLNQQSQPAACYGPGHNMTYTIGICGISFSHGGTVEFTIEANRGGSPTILEDGRVSPIFSVDDKYIPSKELEFIVTDSSKDVTLTFDALQGDVDVYVNPPQPDGNADVPSATDFMWFATTASGFANSSLAGETEIRIPAGNPCQFASHGCTLSKLLVGKYLISVTQRGPITGRFNALFETAGTHVHPTIGQPVMVSLTNNYICRTRDQSGACTSTHLGSAAIAWLSFDIPQASLVAVEEGESKGALRTGTSSTSADPDAVYAASVQFHVSCPGGEGPYCGPGKVNFAVAGQVCNSAVCSNADMWPTAADPGASPPLSVMSSDMQFHLLVPADDCAQSSTVDGSCTVFMGIYGVAADGAPPTSMPPPQVQVLVLDNTATTEVPDVCFEKGHACEFPVQTRSPAFHYSRYSALVSAENPVNVKINVQQCYAGGQIFVCKDEVTAGGENVCNPYNMPGQSNFQVTATYPQQEDKGLPWTTVTLAQQKAPFFFSVLPEAQASLDSTPSFQILIQSGSLASLLMLPEAGVQGDIQGDVLTVTEDGKGNYDVTYGPVYSEATGQRPVEINGLLYTWYLAPNDAITTGAVLNTACGVQVEFAHLVDKGGVSGSGVAGSASIPMPSNPGSYSIMLVARCSAGGCGDDDTLVGQSIAYQPATVTIAGSPSNGKGKKPGPAAGPIVGGIFGALIFVAVVVVAYRNWDSIKRRCSSPGKGSGYAPADDSFYSSADVGASSGYDRL